MMALQKKASPECGGQQEIPSHPRTRPPPSLPETQPRTTNFTEQQICSVPMLREMRPRLAVGLFLLNLDGSLGGAARQASEGRGLEAGCTDRQGPCGVFPLLGAQSLPHSGSPRSNCHPSPRKSYSRRLGYRRGGLHPSGKDFSPGQMAYFCDPLTVGWADWPRKPHADGHPYRSGYHGKLHPNCLIQPRPALWGEEGLGGATAPGSFLNLPLLPFLTTVCLRCPKFKGRRFF